MVLIPAARFGPDFFQLKTRLAGEFLQKYVTYRLRLTITGDFAELAANSDSLPLLIHESNRGEDVWFLPGKTALEKRLEHECSHPRGIRNTGSFLCYFYPSGPVAQLDRASVFGTEGWGFEPLRGRQRSRARIL